MTYPQAAALLQRFPTRFSCVYIPRMIISALALCAGIGIGIAVGFRWALKSQADSRDALKQQLQSVSSEVLSATQRQFLELAQHTMEQSQQRAREDLEHRRVAVDSLMKPVTETLHRFSDQVHQLEKARSGAYEGLTQQVKQLMESQNHLRGETSQLVRALRAPNVRGRWGEIQLRRVVELAGMIAYCDFEEQVSVGPADGRLRPDLSIRLPGGRTIVVDAKAPLFHYLEALEQTDDARRVAKLQEHAKSVKNHIQSLSRKSYWEQFSASPEFVVLFLPGETFFSAALEQDPTLIEAGVEQKVILATPTTLIALLRAVSYGWKNETAGQNARQVAEVGKELHKRVGDLTEHWIKVGKNLGAAVDSYNKAVGTLETRVLVSTRRLTELGAGSVDQIPEIPSIDLMPRDFSRDLR